MNNSDKNTEEIFTQIFRNRAWRSRESASGPGSTVSITKTIRGLIPDLIARYEIKSILDIPCGDFNWMKEVDLSTVNYTGADLVADLIQENRKKYLRTNINFVQLDLIANQLPKADLVLTRDCMVHLSFSDCADAIKNLKNSGSRLLLTTTFPEVSENQDIKTGEFRKINLLSEPFLLPSPLEIYSENHDININPNKCLGLWEIDTL